MSLLKVPDNGLQLESSESAPSAMPTQVFPVTLSDSVIEDMIKCVQKGEEIQLSLGSRPTFLYGSKSHTPAPTSDSCPVDTFLTKPFESLKQAFRVPNTTSLWEKPGSPDPESSDQAGRTKNVTSSSVSSALDSDVETLQNSIAAAEASKKQTNILDKMPKKAANKSAPKSKYLSSMASYGGNGKNSSLPSSPGLNAVGSPSLNQGYGASQQTLEKAKGQRTMIVHELAAAERPSDYLETKWSGNGDDFKPTLEKVADYSADTKNWMLKKLYWKELDVWKYDYDTQEARQKAIDNAIKIFDRMRLGVEEPQWERLLPREERGKGKVLSKVQANIARGPTAPAPKIKVQKADDAASDANEDALKVEDGDGTARSSSQSASTLKKKKPDTQTKRLLSNKPKAATPKPAPTKAAKAKSAASTSTASGKRGPLSSEYVYDSDSDSSESKVENAKASTATKASPAPAAKPVTSSATQSAAPSPKPQPKARAVERPTERESAKPAKAQQPAKRRREEEDDASCSSSSSGQPLAKRIKPKTSTGEKAPQKANVKQRPAASESRGASTNGNLSFKSTKNNTSPAKSSPLASSPPTNASDLEQQRRNPPPDPIPSRKRKAPAETSDDASSSRGSTTSSGDSGIIRSGSKQRRLEADLVLKAQNFKRTYDKYANLHREISDMVNPPQEKMSSLLNMRQKLKQMKTEIYRDCPRPVAVA